MIDFFFWDQGASFITQKAGYNQPGGIAVRMMELDATQPSYIHWTPAWPAHELPYYKLY
jgi:hypothetical protein